MANAGMNEEKIIEYLNEDGEYHREDGPALIYPNGNVYWMINHMHTREGKPTWDRPTGYKRWYKDNIKIWPKLN